MLLKTGFGNIFDVGYGWDYEGQLLVAAAINARTPREEDTAWEAVEKFCRKKEPLIPAC